MFRSAMIATAALLCLLTTVEARPAGCPHRWCGCYMRTHHVGKLVSQVSGNIWLVHSGNDGRAVRTRERSIAGAIGFRQ